MSMDRYRTLSGDGDAQLREKASRFVAIAFHIADEDDFKQRRNMIAREHHTSRHVCFAWVLDEDGSRFRSNDAGEPSGTAGRPILQRIRKLGLTHTAVIVVRYFGGTLLGKAGLVRAYGQAAAMALEKASVEERVMRDHVSVTCSYAQVEALRNEVLSIEGEVTSSDFGEECLLLVALPKSMVEDRVQAWTEQGMKAMRTDQ